MRTGFNWRANFGILIQIYETDDVNLKFHIFNDIIKSKFVDFVPKRVIVRRDVDMATHLNSPSIIRARALSNIAVRTYKRSVSRENCVIYCVPHGMSRTV